MAKNVHLAHDPGFEKDSSSHVQIEIQNNVLNVPDTKDQDISKLQMHVFKVEDDNVPQVHQQKAEKWMMADNICKVRSRKSELKDTAYLL